jgi:hypothetical protein
MLNKLPAKIQADINAFASRALEGTAKQAHLNSISRILPVKWKGELIDGLQINSVNKQNWQVKSTTAQGWLFERGYQGPVPVTPLLKEWGQDKKVMIPDKGTFDVNFRRRPTYYRFMFKSIPKKQEFKPISDMAFSQTMRGGTV